MCEPSIEKNGTLKNNTKNNFNKYDLGLVSVEEYKAVHKKSEIEQVFAGNAQLHNASKITYDNSVTKDISVMTDN